MDSPVMHQHADVCIIDPDDDERRQIVEILRRAGYCCVAAEDPDSGLALIQQNEPKVILADWDLSDDHGLKNCRLYRGQTQLVPTFFIMVTAREDEALRNLALENGVDDYLIKPVDSSFLLARVRVGIRMWQINENLRQAAITDGLTGLYNHDHLNILIDRELKRAHRYGGRLSFIMIDLDFFKAVNDTFGHLVGNKTLEDVARILRLNVRDVDIVGRFGGEEFAIIAPEANLEDATAICERIRHGIPDGLQVDELKNHRVTASFGVASADDTRVRNSADLIELADRALYQAKSGGRNQVVTASDIENEFPPTIEAKEVENLRRQVAVLSVQAKEVYVQTVSALLQALEEKDPFTARHSTNVSYYSELMARALGLSEPLIVSVRNAGLLHDVGKVGIPDRILLKPTQLTEVEAMVMRQVPAISVRIIDYLRILDSEMHIIRHQGEHFDGSGHPDGLTGGQIPIGSRIVLVANAFDAMTTDRLYRSCRTVADACAELRRLSGQQFDPTVVECFLAHIDSHRNLIRQRIRETVEALRLSPSAV